MTLRVFWSGGFFTNASLAIVNRRMVQTLLRRGNVEIAIGTFPMAPSALAPEFIALAERKPFGATEADVTVVHEWPPHFAVPACSRYVHIQPWEYGSMPREWFDALHGECDDLWTHSRYNRDCYAEAGFPRERLAVIPHGIDPELYVPRATHEDRGTFRFLFVGGTIARKGVNILIDAYTRAFSAGDDVALVIKDANTATFYRGQGVGEDLRALAARPGMPRIDYLDTTFADQHMPELYRSTDCFVLPYRGEGFGLPVLEAMACGLPVIVTAGGATDDFVDESVGWRIPSARVELAAHEPPLPTVGTPWILEPDTDALAKLLREAYEDRAAVRRRGDAAAQRAHAHWTWDHAAAIVEQRLNDVMDREPVPAVHRDERYRDPATYAERVFGAGELDAVLLELFTRLPAGRRVYVELTHGAPPSLALVLGRALQWRGLALDGDPSSARVLRTRYAEIPGTATRVVRFSAATIAQMLRADGIEPDFDLLSLQCGDAVEIWEALEDYRPRAVVCAAEDRAALERCAPKIGYACIAVDRSRGDALFVRGDLVARAGFAVQTPVLAAEPRA